MVDFYRDLKIGRDRDIKFTATKDLALTENKDENVSQSIGILVSPEVRTLLGGSISSEVVQLAEAAVQRAVEKDVQITDVLSVEIIEINEVTKSATVRVLLQENTEFTFTITE